MDKKTKKDIFEKLDKIAELANTTGLDWSDSKSSMSKIRFLVNEIMIAITDTGE